MTERQDDLRWFEAIGLEDVPLVGGKSASLGELYRELRPLDVRVPNGFAVTAPAYRKAIAAAGAEARLRSLFEGLDVRDVERLAACGAEARRIVHAATGTEALRSLLGEAYAGLEAEYGRHVAVAVRSSATAEDLPTASFAGQHESFLNIRGVDDLFEACRRCFASLFTDRAIVYRVNNGFDHFKVALSVAVMKMVRSDRASSGVVFTLDTESGFRDVVLVTGAWGLGETVVQGKVDPDEFTVHKPTYRQGYRAVLHHARGTKAITMVLDEGPIGSTTVEVPTPAERRDMYCLDDAEVLALAGQAIAIEDHYSRRAGHPVPMDIEWAKDATDGALYIVQARPETVASRASTAELTTYRLTGTGEVLARGKAVGEKIATGTARIVGSLDDLKRVQPGDVLVAGSTSPDWEPVMKTAAAIVTDHGGRTCHAAIVARELGLPAVVGTGDATRTLAGAGRVTVCCAEGDSGTVRAGDVPFEVARVPLGDRAAGRTRVMVNLGNPDLAFGAALLPGDGVGLARMEFIISERIGVHPLAVLHAERLDEAERQAVAARARGHASPRAFFVETLAEGIGTIAAAFHPRPVILRLSDFKTNEYAGLIGGRVFEPREANPMLGFRGAARYAHPGYREGFALECAAVRRVRRDMGLVNLAVMVPFCRRVEEAEAVLAALAANGLPRGSDGLAVHLMCEIPNNVVRIDAFARLFDGFSIGSNDLTQLALGVDRDSDLVAFDFDESDPGVLELMRLAIAGAHRNGRTIGICGEAPANDPAIARFLVEVGIDSISVNPASLPRMIDIVRTAEASAATAA